MQFEHLVEVNDFNNGFVPYLTRDQLWKGLLRRLEEPHLFLEGVESVEVIKKSETKWMRQMQLGILDVEEEITLYPLEKIICQAIKSETHGGGSLVMTIEEPEPQSLFVRFAYETHHFELEDPLFEDFIKQAYLQTDIDTIRKIFRFSMQ